MLFTNRPDGAIAPDGGPLADASQPGDGPCMLGQLLCQATCVNPRTDNQHCGGCGMACLVAGTTCVNGACACAALQTLCGGRCTLTDSDPANCGMCGQACAAGEVCNRGRCRAGCQPRFTDCNGKCVEVMVDPMNCGTCGTVCAVGQACRAGVCR